MRCPARVGPVWPRPSPLLDNLCKKKRQLENENSEKKRRGEQRTKNNGTRTRCLPNLRRRARTIRRPARVGYALLLCSFYGKREIIRKEEE